MPGHFMHYIYAGTRGREVQQVVSCILHFIAGYGLQHTHNSQAQKHTCSYINTHIHTQIHTEMYTHSNT